MLVQVVQIRCNTVDNRVKTVKLGLYFSIMWVKNHAGKILKNSKVVLHLLKSRYAMCIHKTTSL